jgi:hypothetical protein
MTNTEYERTSEYRNQLQKSLELAKLNLSPRHFEATAEGLRAEIIRLTGDLERHRLQAFLTQSSQFPTMWRFVAVIQRSIATVRPEPSATFNSPQEATPWSSGVTSSSIQVDDQYPMVACTAG